MGTDGLLFPSPGLTDKDKPRERRNVARVIRSRFDDAGLGWATPHALRRTVATTIDAAGLPVALAAHMLGHANVSMRLIGRPPRFIDSPSMASGSDPRVDVAQLQVEPQTCALRVSPPGRRRRARSSPHAQCCATTSGRIVPV